MSRDDLWDIGALIRRAYAKAPYLNAWSFARFDIWAQRRLADEQVFGRREWQRDICLWRDERGGLAGAALFPYTSAPFHDPHSAALVLAPERPDLAETMLAWVEAHHAQADAGDGTPRVEAFERNAPLERLLEARGYIKPARCFIHRVRRLRAQGVDPIELPHGYRITQVDTDADMQKRLRAVRSVFHVEETVEMYRCVRQAPSFSPELDLVAVAERGDVAAFCTAWVDRANRIAEIEPLGVVADHRRRGLATALLAEACNRLCEIEVETVTVSAWSESAAANRLYESCGLAEADRFYNWRRGFDKMTR